MIRGQQGNEDGVRLMLAEAAASADPRVKDLAVRVLLRSLKWNARRYHDASQLLGWREQGAGRGLLAWLRWLRAALRIKAPAVGRWRPI